MAQARTSWRRVRLKYLAAEPIVTGLGEAGRDAGAGSVRYIRTTDIAGRTSLDPDKWVSLEPELASRADVRRGDVLVCVAGSLGVTYLHCSDEPACFAGYLARFRPGPEVDSRFVSYWAQTALFLDQVSMGAVRSTIDNFSAGKVRNLELDVPPLDEQRRIADYLDEEDATTSRLAMAIQARRDLVASRYLSVLAAAYGVEPSPAFLAGGHGGGVPLGALLDGTVAGRTPDPAILDDGDLPWLSIGDLDDGGTTYDGSRSFSPQTLIREGVRLAPAGAIALAMYASLGKVSLLGRAAAFNQAIIGLVPRPDVPADFLVGWLELARPSLPALARTSTQANLNAEQVRTLRVPDLTAPRRASVAQVRVTARAQLDDLLGRQDRQLAVLQERWQSLITEAVTGPADMSSARGVA